MAMPQGPDTANRVDTAWERWSEASMEWTPYLLLVVSTVFASLGSDAAPGGRPVTIALAAAAATWVYILFTRSPKPYRDHRARMAVYFVGFLVIASALMIRNPFYFVFAITGFFHASLLRPWPLTVLGVAATSILINTLITGFPWPTIDQWFLFGAIIVIQTVAIGLGTVLGERLSELSEERRAAVTRLEAALQENAGLQRQLVAQAREAGVLEERGRMAREIHDTIAHGLTGIVTQLEAAEGAETRPEDRRRHTDNALRLARDSLVEARRSVEASRPEALDGVSLPDALDEMARRWSELNDVEVEVRITGDPIAMHPEIEAALLRTAQEALANVAKHAHASRAGVTLSYMGDVVSLDVRDDGVGFAVDVEPAERAAGFGLTAMRQRVTRVAGTLAIESEPGGGTAISARVPAIAAGRRGERPSRGRLVSPIRLLIVDDHPVVRDGLRGMFAGDAGFQVVGEAADGDEAVAAARTLQPDVILMDLRMPRADGTTAIRRLAEQGIGSRVLVLTTYDTDSDVVPAIEAGATGYLLKDSPREELFRAVRAAHEGESVLAPSVASRLMQQLRTPTQDALSERELEVLGLIAQGETNRGAASRLFISEATVKTHLLHIYAKLDVNDRAAAVATAYERGLLTPRAR